MQNGSFFPDDASGTGLDVYKTEHTAPPPGWSDGAQGGKEQPTVWNFYSKKAEHYDDDLIEDANNTVEVLLIFAGLFSAVVTAFISQTYPMLKPDPGDTLTAILQELQHPGSSAVVQPFITPTYAVRVNCFLFAGLFISMIVALLSILVKQWARSYQRDLAGVSSPHLRARIRHFRYNGARRWHFTDIVGILSIFMHLALLISGIGIIDLLLSTAPTVGYVALSIFLAGMTFFISTTVTPLVVLDAPFRSPLSKLMTGIHRRFKKSKPKSRKKKGDDEEGLEDHLEQSQGRESEENSIVRTQFHLDLDILSHLLGEADKSTERWLLDLCFEKLPQLSLLEKRDPDLILRRKIILEVYTFLAKGCVGINKNGEKEAEPTRLQRARKLCEFLSWFLSLRQTPDVRDFVRQLLTTNNFDPRELPLALAQDDNNTASVTRAYSALGRVEHLLDKEGKEPGPGCSACSTKYAELSHILRTEDPNVTAVQKSRVITGFLIQRTDCTLCWEKSVKGDWASKENEKVIAMFDAEVKLLQEGFKECAPTDNNKKIWDKALKDKETSGSESMKTVWFTPLLETLKGLQIQRGHSPIWKNSGSNMSSPAASRSPSTFANNSRLNNNPRSPGISFSGSSNYSTPTPTLNVPPNNFV